MGLKTTPLAGAKSLKVQHLKNNHNIVTGHITTYLTNDEVSVSCRFTVCIRQVYVFRYTVLRPV